MQIADILRHKGSAVVTMSPDGAVTDLLDLLAERNIGAIVVTDSAQVVGIVSERDVVRRLGEHGADVLHGSVADIMTSPVLSCGTQDSVDSVANTMTERRVRHMPVLEDGRLVGLVSIGDVVLSRMRQLEQDRGQLEQYITG
jgi:CBS domain-containing protein